MKISMLVYPKMTLLDLMGPLQVWTFWPEAEIQTVWKDRSPLPTDSAAVLLPTHTFEESFETPNILFVPGGAAGTIAAMKDEGILSYLRDRGQRADWVTSVCTGALILGAAGLLQGYKATTHWIVHDMLSKFGAEPVKERWVIDRNRASGGGVTAGIDFGLAIMAKVAGEEIARIAQLAMEYDPAPPFDAGSPEKASKKTLEAVLADFAAASGAQASSDG